MLIEVKNLSRQEISKVRYTFHFRRHRIVMYIIEFLTESLAKKMLIRLFPGDQNQTLIRNTILYS